jgi:long-subunit fatty acid transport protein
VDVKLGAIFRPIEASPFRIGLYINTPTWYRLTCRTEQSASFFVDPNNNVDVQTGKVIVDDTYGNSTKWDYNVNTPWKFGISLGHTIANMFAIGLTYQYSDYSAIDNRRASIDTYDYVDGWGWGYTESYRTSYSDNVMNRNTERSLKGVSLLKLGFEAKPVPEVAIRLGYNFQSAIYDKNGTKETTLDTDGSYLASNSFTNWGDTHRITFGLGFKLAPSLNLDMAYQYATTKGDYYPFEKMTETSSTVGNIPVSTEVKDNRHQLSATLGYRF